jgi:hypothetical protein
MVRVESWPNAKILRLGSNAPTYMPRASAVRKFKKVMNFVLLIADAASK